MPIWSTGEVGEHQGPVYWSTRAKDSWCLVEQMSSVNNVMIVRYYPINLVPVMD